VGDRELPRAEDRLAPDRRLSLRFAERPAAGEPAGALVFFHGEVELDEPARTAAQLAPIAEWVDALPFPADRVVLGGWSQGAAVAALLGLAAGRARPAALLVLGGSLALHAVELDLRPPLPRVAIAHGTDDDVVPVAAARNLRALLELAGADVLYRETGVGHELDQAVVPDLCAFLARVGG
jgi:predicted esterase